MLSLLCDTLLDCPKRAGLHRKKSTFYRSRMGACVGDIYRGLIDTCELNDANAFDYLNQLQLCVSDVAEHPDRWMPWNYQDRWAPADRVF